MCQQNNNTNKPRVIPGSKPSRQDDVNKGREERINENYTRKIMSIPPVKNPPKDS